MSAGRNCKNLHKPRAPFPAQCLVSSMRIRELRQSAREHLRQAASSQPEASADILLARALGQNIAWLYAHPEAEIEPDKLRIFESWLHRRATGQPTQYITGVQEFYGREFHVNPAVLVPRPETEILIEAALERALQFPAPRIADIGTGSGCIAITLALELAARHHAAQVWGVDISAPALAVAQANARNLRAPVQWLQGDLLEPWRRELSDFEAVNAPEHLDMIVSNPPYIAETELESLQKEVREHEPRLALIAGPTGMEAYDRLLPQARELLHEGGWLILELGHATAWQILPVLQNPDWNALEIRKDLQGIPRVLIARRAHDRELSRQAK